MLQPGKWTFWPLRAALSVTLFFAACAASKVDYTLLDQGIHSGKRVPSLHFEVIRTEEAFEKLFTELYSDLPGKPERREIDFGSSLVLFVAMGEKPSAGYRVRIDGVTRSKETLRVKIGLQEPPPERFQAIVMTYPFVLVEIKKAADLKKVEWVDAQERKIGESEIR